MASSGLHSPDFTIQLRYISEWFADFSPLQKGDFMPILIEQFSSNRHYNGLPPTHGDEAPSETPHPSIFQCRVKLFIQWATTWSHSQKWEFLNSIRIIDPEFVEQFLQDCSFDPQPPPENE